MQETEIHSKLIKECIAGKRDALKEFYKLFHGYAMSICLRYAESRDDAVEMMNDGFLKAFTYLKKFDMERPIKPWIRKIMINCALDHLKKYESKMEERYIDEQIRELISETDPGAVSYEDILDMVRLLPMSYRIVFNLYAIEGYKHEEIASMLGITSGTSKSHYFKAKQRLQELLAIHFDTRK